MKKLLLVLFLISSVAVAAPRLTVVGPSGEEVTVKGTADGKLAVDATLTVGSITVAIAPVATGTATTTTLVANVEKVFTVSATCKDFLLCNLGTGTIWLDFNNTAVVGDGVPVVSGGSYSRDAELGFSVRVVSSQTSRVSYTEGKR